MLRCCLCGRQIQSAQQPSKQTNRQDSRIQITATMCLTVRARTQAPQEEECRNEWREQSTREKKRELNLMQWGPRFSPRRCFQLSRFYWARANSNRRRWRWWVTQFEIIQIIELGLLGVRAWVIAWIICCSIFQDTHRERERETHTDTRNACYSINILFGGNTRKKETELRERLNSKATTTTDRPIECIVSYDA